jgi:hypothetical protein
VEIWRYRDAPPQQQKGYSRPLFGRIFEMWVDWQRGVPPSREWKGRGAQNPRLLQAFAALDRARARINASSPEGGRETPEAFAARVRREVAGR